VQQAIVVVHFDDGFASSDEANGFEGKDGFANNSKKKAIEWIACIQIRQGWRGPMRYLRGKR
jgi:hypothetical protein